MRDLIAGLDGSETVLVGEHRVLRRPPFTLADEHADATPDEVAALLGAGDPQSELIPIGEDIAIAAELAARFGTAGGVINAIHRAGLDNQELARELEPLAPGGPLAAAHSTRYPIVQGPMTRVSDRAEFADAVARAGGLPFLALALLRRDATSKLLAETAALLQDQPWGVGILGFVPAELREEQLAAIAEVRPPFALIAGGRPAQARALEKLGITTYLHVPSPGLLEMFLQQGARRFVFEGRECGGHVGPRSSFSLWEAQLQVLRNFDEPEELSILFAGGIHDGRSAAMVSALAAPLAARGAKIGVLMGTAYLFTEEAVSTGAIVEGYQEQALGCDQTVLLETGPGHATRCVDSDYVKSFRSERRRLEQEGVDPKDMWLELERLNLGRLRLASKGRKREGDEIVEVSAAEQKNDGMFMIGQVASLRDRRTTIEALHEEVSGGSTGQVAAQPADTEDELGQVDVAVVGMACVFPKSPDLATYWSNIVRGVDAIEEVEPQRWNPEIYYNPDGDPAQQTPSKWGGFLSPIAFDPMQYGIPPKSMASIEPVQILSLEVAQRALEDAGYGEREFDRTRTSVIFGAEGGTDLSAGLGFRALYSTYAGELPDELDHHLPRLTEDSFPGVLTNVIAGRIANRLDLGGMNYTVDAACASAMAAVEAGVQTLVAGTSDMVLVGGADLHNSINDYLMFASVHALSPRGRCRPFDRGADGISLGEGIGVVVLKRLVDAKRDGDRIYSVILGTGASSDGKSLGLTAPRAEGQSRALELAYRRAATPINDVELMEAHGTGTVVGDRTELESMTAMFARGQHDPATCTLGSVKSQIGHTKCAAGIASLIKVSLALHRGVLPPTLGIEQPNKGYTSGSSPFVFRDTACPWPAPESGQRIAAVSAFGFGGTNFHAVMRNHPSFEQQASGLEVWPSELFLFRGATREEAVGRIEALTKQVSVEKPWSLRDLAATACTAGSGPAQIALVADDLAELLELLAVAARGDATDRVFYRSQAEEPEGAVAFLFPGQGSQYTNMLADLFVAFPQLQELVERGSRWAPHIFPPQAFSRDEQQAQEARLTDTTVAQPALGMVSLAMAQLLKSLGVEPEMTAGHSYGELVALCVAGSLPESGLLELSEARAVALLEAAGEDTGAMAAVAAGADKVEAALQGVEGVVLANHNAPRQTVLSGPRAAIKNALARLEEQRIVANEIPVACAFHSSVVAGAETRFAATLASAEVEAPRLPVWSNTTAERHDGDGDELRRRLAKHLVEPVLFRQQIESMYEAGARVFVEVGPGRVLSSLVRKILKGRPHRVIATNARGESGITRLMLSLAELAVNDVPVDTGTLFNGRGARAFDLEAPPARTHAPMTWMVDGFRAYPLNGTLPAEAIHPLQSPPVKLVPADARPTDTQPTVGDREAVVLEYLRNLRETAEAQKQVVLGYLGATPAPATTEPVVRHEAVEVPIAEPAEPAAQLPAPEAEPEPAVDIQTALLQIVSERTGYPLEMLDLDLDLEADLGIDSIKRIEILGALHEKADMAGGDADERDALVEELAAIKTLRGILEWLDGHATDDEPAPSNDSEGGEAADDLGDPVDLRRFVLEVQQAPAVVTNGISLEGRSFALTDDGLGVALELQQRLRDSGARAEILEPGDHDPGPVDGLVHLAMLSPQTGPEDVRALFQLAKTVLDHEAAWVMAATGLGGLFGTAENGADHSYAGGAAGLIKSLAKEKSSARICTIDLDPTADPSTLADHLFNELIATDGLIEVAYEKDGVRRTLAPVKALLDDQEDSAALLDKDSVVLITGGARGITASVAVELARRFGCKLELVGRSPEPADEEGPLTAEISDPLAVKRALIESNDGATPAEIEVQTRQLLAAREIRATLRQLRDLGCEVRYHSLDVRDNDAFGERIDELYKRHGKIDGVIHGAGVVEDKLLTHKTSESFDRVFDTKVKGALTLAGKIRDDARFVVFFSSISAAFGNRGQVDYAAANDVLDKLAHSWNRRLDGRVLSINWGPWDSTGMVSDELRREYARRGIGLISEDQGIQGLVDEIRSGDKRFAQVILMSADPTALG